MDKKENCFRFDTEFNSSLSFPAEFPYEFDSFGSSSDIGSPVESTETESRDQDDFLAGLTRRLTQQLVGEPNYKKKWVMAGSPESTLRGIGSWSFSSNGSPNSELSPPTTPFGAKDYQRDLIGEAAGHVARLKMSCESNKNIYDQGRGLLCSARSQTSDSSGKNQIYGFCSSQRFGQSVSHFNQYKNQVRQDQELMKPHCSSVWGKQQVKVGWQAQPHHQIQNRGRCVRPLGLPQSAWPPLQVQPNLNQHQHQHYQQSHLSSPGTRAPFLATSNNNNNNTKRESSGTGVFLPRRYSNSSDCKKKPACPTTVQVPAKVVQTLNLNLKDMNLQSHALNSAFEFNYDDMIARRNALLAKQKGNLVGHESVLNHHEISLPQEWIY